MGTEYLLPVAAYLLGSVSSAVIVSRLMGLPDPRSEGSKNPGATNVLRLGGKKAAVVTLLGDLLKGVIPVLIARMLTDSPWILSFTALGAFLGHLYPVLFAFKGGKGVATALGAFIALSPWLGLWLIVTWLVVALLSRYSSLAALVAAACSPILVWFVLHHRAFVLTAVVIAVLLIWRHRTNIHRLVTGEESKINFSK